VDTSIRVFEPDYDEEEEAEELETEET
jgi:hypothetical protein